MQALQDYQLILFWEHLHCRQFLPLLHLSLVFAACFCALMIWTHCPSHHDAYENQICSEKDNAKCTVHMKANNESITLVLIKIYQTSEKLKTKNPKKNH